MARRKKSTAPQEAAEETNEPNEDLILDEESTEEPVPEDEIICKLTQERRKVTPEETIIQDLIDQLHREYRVDLANMARDLSFRISDYDETAGKKKSLTRRAALVVYKTGTSGETRTDEDIIRVVMVAKKGTQPENKNQGVEGLKNLLSYLAQQQSNSVINLYGAWTNGDRLAFFRAFRNHETNSLKPKNLQISQHPMSL